MGPCGAPLCLGTSQQQGHSSPSIKAAPTSLRGTPQSRRAPCTPLLGWELPCTHRTGRERGRAGLHQDTGGSCSPEPQKAPAANPCPSPTALCWAKGLHGVSALLPCRVGVPGCSTSPTKPPVPCRAVLSRVGAGRVGGQEHAVLDGARQQPGAPPCSHCCRCRCRAAGVCRDAAVPALPCQGLEQTARGRVLNEKSAFVLLSGRLAAVLPL